MPVAGMPHQTTQCQFDHWKNQDCRVKEVDFNFKANVSLLSPKIAYGHI